MKTDSPVRSNSNPGKWMLGCLLSVVVAANAAPVFPLPNPAVHPPGFVLHLPFPGPLLLPPGGAPPEVGPWAITAFSAPGMPGPGMLDTAVLEYPFPMGGVGLDAIIPGGAPGAAFGPVLPGAPGISLSLAPVPEPTAATLLGLGLLGMVCRRVRR